MRLLIDNVCTTSGDVFRVRKNSEINRVSFLVPLKDMGFREVNVVETRPREGDHSSARINMVNRFIKRSGKAFPTVSWGAICPHRATRDVVCAFSHHNGLTVPVTSLHVILRRFTGRDSLERLLRFPSDQGDQVRRLSVCELGLRLQVRVTRRQEGRPSGPIRCERHARRNRYDSRRPASECRQGGVSNVIKFLQRGMAPNCVGQRIRHNVLLLFRRVVGVFSVVRKVISGRYRFEGLTSLFPSTLSRVGTSNFHVHPSVLGRFLQLIKQRSARMDAYRARVKTCACRASESRSAVRDLYLFLGSVARLLLRRALCFAWSYAFRGFLLFCFFRVVIEPSHGNGVAFSVHKSSLVLSLGLEVPDIYLSLKYSSAA